MSIQYTTVTGTVLAATEFLYFYVLVTTLTPPNLQNKYDGCMQNFSVHHALIFPNGGLVIERHNEIREKIIHLKN